MIDEMVAEQEMPKKNVSPEEEAHEITNQILAMFKSHEISTHTSYAKIGYSLNLMANGKKYKSLGYKNMNEYIKDIGKSRAICYNMMDYYTYLASLVIAYPDLTKYPVSYLCREIIPMLKEVESGVREDVDRRVEIAEIMGKLSEIADLPDSDRSDEIRGMKGKKKHVDCAHESLETWYRCKDCGKFVKKA